MSPSHSEAEATLERVARALRVPVPDILSEVIELRAERDSLRAYADLLRRLLVRDGVVDLPG